MADSNGVTDTQIRKLRVIAAQFNLPDLIHTTMWALGEMPKSKFFPERNVFYQENARRKCVEIIELLQAVAPQLGL